MRIALGRVAATLLLAAFAGPAAAQFTSGNLVIYQAGDGSAPLATTGNVVRLREFTTGGTASGFSVTMPSTGTGNRLITSGTPRDEGLMTLGSNGQTLALTGYNSAALLSGDLAATASTTVNRTVALVNGQGTATYTSLSDFADGGSPRGAFTTNGIDLWVTGGAGSVRYATAGSTTSTQLSTTPTSLRGVAVFGGQLYVSSNSSNAQLATVGTGTPTTSGQTITNLTGVPTSGSRCQFVLFRMGNPTFAGPNVLYLTGDTTTNSILKYTTADGATWIAAGSATATGVRGLTGRATSDNNVTLYGTTGGTTSTGGGTIYSFTDGDAQSGTISGSATAINTLASGSTAPAYRGIAFAPATLVYSGSGNWDTVPGHANWKNTAVGGTPASMYFNVYAANFGDITGDKTVNVESGLYPQAVNVTNAANTYTFTNTVSSSGIQGLGALTKSGAGTLVLASPNTYAGGTVVGGGTLVVANDTASGTGVGSVAVGSGGTLAGTGTIAPLTGSSVTVAAGGAIRGGNPVGSAAQHLGTLTVSSNVTINSTASTNGILRVEVSRTGGNGVTGTANTSLLSLSGAGSVLNLNPGAGNKFTIDIVNGASSLQANESYTITLAAVATAGNVQLNGSSLSAGATIAAGNFTLSSSDFSFAGVSLGIDATGKQLMLQFTPVPVPEPATILGVAAGALGLARLVRQRAGHATAV